MRADSGDCSDPELFERLAAIARDRDGGSDAAALLYDRHGVLVVRAGAVVAKAHQADRDGGPLLARRMRIADGLSDLLLTSLGPPRTVAGRVVTLWPYGEPVSPDALPWEDAGRLLAHLHSAPVPEGAPAWGRPARVARVVGALPDGADATPIRRAYATLPRWVRGEGPPPDGPRSLLHGDWHLGQMVRVQGSWRLIDVEDLGTGDPVWDLARPAALYCAGVLLPDDWALLLHAYRTSGGPAVPGDGELWDVLDVPARALVVQIAATCVQSAHAADRPLEDAERALVDACARISVAGSPA